MCPDPRIEFLGRIDQRQLAGVRARSTAIYFPTGLESFGYPLAEARAGGGVWYETATGVYQAAGKEATWETNQAFLQQMMEHGVDKLEFHGLDIDQARRGVDISEHLRAKN